MFTQRPFDCRALCSEYRQRMLRRAAMVRRPHRIRKEINISQFVYTEASRHGAYQVFCQFNEASAVLPVTDSWPQHRLSTDGFSFFSEASCTAARIRHSAAFACIFLELKTDWLCKELIAEEALLASIHSASKQRQSEKSRWREKSCRANAWRHSITPPSLISAPPRFAQPDRLYFLPEICPIRN